MRRLWLAPLVLASFASSAKAQPGPSSEPDASVAPVTSPAPAPAMPLQIVAPTQRAIPFDRVMYILDVSGSMRDQLAEAITVTDTFCSDGFKAAVVTFSDSHARWDGVREPCKHPATEACGHNCLEPGWAWMPAHRVELFRHLRSFAGDGGTNPASALDYAFKNAPAGTLIVFISDGIFSHDGDAGPVASMRAAQAWRRTRSLAPVQMLVWSVSEADSKRESLVELARLGGGGLWRADVQRTGPW